MISNIADDILNFRENFNYGKDMILTMGRFIEYDSEGFTLQEAVAEAKRCLHCAKPMCRTGCPIENEIPDFIAEMAKGNLGAASDIIARRSNLPAVCGRVCPHERQCEGSCVLNHVGKGIKIGKIERFIADMDGEYNLVPPKATKKQAGNVCVIGSGPAGLTIAGDLAKLGFAVTVFESQQEAGGVLMYGIPEFRLPKQVVRREVEKIEKLGVKFQMNTQIGPDFTIDKLFADGFDAIFIGTGNSVSKPLPVEGAKLNGVVQATYFLQIMELSRQGGLDVSEVPIKKGDCVIVVGAGNTAIDAARTAARMGAQSVTIVNRRRECDMAALPSEVEQAKGEGVKFLHLHATIGVEGEDAVTGLKCRLRTAQENGDDVKIVDTEEEVVLPANKVIIAVGQKPSSRIVDSTKGVEVDEYGFVKTRENPYGMTTRSGVFAGGDVVNGPATVVRAMKDAKLVAQGIAQYVEAKKLMESCGLSAE